jgi:hypothetical protein
MTGATRAKGGWSSQRRRQSGEGLQPRDVQDVAASPARSHAAMSPLVAADLAGARGGAPSVRPARRWIPAGGALWRRRIQGVRGPHQRVPAVASR